MTNETNKTNNPANKFTDLSNVLIATAEVKSTNYTLGEIFQHNGRNVQVVELQAQGVYHVKATDAPFDSYWINTGGAVDITNVTDAE